MPNSTVKARMADDVLRVSEPATLREHAYAKLRRAIANGHLRPGQRLIERDLCARMGISRTPLREAIRQLERDGLVRTAPYRGPTVATLTPEDARHLFELRAGLEGIAARYCAERVDAAVIARLEASLRPVAGVAGANDIDRLIEWNNRFHDAIAEGSGNPYLRDQLTGLRQRLLLLRSASLVNPVRRRDVLREHRAILRLIRLGRAADAQRVCEAHVLAASASALAAHRRLSRRAAGNDS